MKEIFQDWAANKGNTKGRFLTVAYRLAVASRRRGVHWRLFGAVYVPLYKVAVCWVLGVELPMGGRVGPGLKLFHAQGLIVHDDVVIGASVTLRHNTTIGLNGRSSVPPIIGDGTDIGANSVLLGPITVGSNVIVGAGSVVAGSVPDYHTVVGNPARVLSACQPE